MGITGKHVEAGVKIMRLVLDVHGIKSPTVTDIIDRAYSVSTIIVRDGSVAEREKLRDAIITRMVTINAEVQ